MSRHTKAGRRSAFRRHCNGHLVIDSDHVVGFLIGRVLDDAYTDFFDATRRVFALPYFAVPHDVSAP